MHPGRASEPLHSHSVDVTEIIVFLELRAEVIDVFKVRRIGIQPFAVDDKMVIIANAHVLATQGNQALDVKGILLADTFDPMRFEDDDFATLGMTEIKGEAVDKQMVSGSHLHLDNVVPLAEWLTLQWSGVVEKVLTW